jgi:predicted HTH domain antitoxin
MADTVQINLRLDTDLARELEQIAREESLRKTDIVRKYVIEGVKNRRLEQAIRRFQLGQITLERAAQSAGLTIYEMMDVLRDRGITLDQTTPQQARDELRSLLAEWISLGERT